MATLISGILVLQCGEDVKRGAAHILQDPLVLGVVLFGLLVVPFFAYGVLSMIARRGVNRGGSREETTPSTTQAHPSRNIPGGGKRER